MSEKSWELDITPTAAETYEATVLSGKTLLKGRARAILIAQGFFIGVCAPLGATMIVWLVVMMSGGPEFSDLPGWAIPVTFMGFGMLAFWFSRQSHFLIAQATVRSRFGRSQRVVLDRSGITLKTQNSRWYTGWADVQSVSAGPKTLCVGISGIAIALPRHAFLGPQDADDALALMREWQEGAQ